MVPCCMRAPICAARKMSQERYAQVFTRNGESALHILSPTASAAPRAGWYMPVWRRRATRNSAYAVAIICFCPQLNARQQRAAARASARALRCGIAARAMPPQRPLPRSAQLARVGVRETRGVRGARRRCSARSARVCVQGVRACVRAARVAARRAGARARQQSGVRCVRAVRARARGRACEPAHATLRGGGRRWVGSEACATQRACRRCARASPGGSARAARAYAPATPLAAENTRGDGVCKVPAGVKRITRMMNDRRRSR